MIRKSGGGRGALYYGSERIHSLDGDVYKWTFKIIQFTSKMWIGIDETKYIRKDRGRFDDKRGMSKCYGLFDDGDGSWFTQSGRPQAFNRYYSIQYNTGDKVVMTLDLKSQTLSYQFNQDKILLLGVQIVYGTL